MPSKHGSGNGPDIVAVKRQNGKTGPITEVHVEECKASAKRKPKGPAQTKHGGQQMSKKWMKHQVTQLKKQGGRKCKTAQAIADAMDPNSGVKMTTKVTKGKQTAKGKKWKIYDD